MVRIGLRISALFREFLIAHAGIPFPEAERLSLEFDSQIVGADWLSTLNGTTYNRGFDPANQEGNGE